MLIGHSLGGAIAAKVSYKVLTTNRKENEEIAKHLHGINITNLLNLVGIIIIDVC